MAGAQTRQGIDVCRTGIPVVQHDNDDAATTQPRGGQVEQLHQIGIGCLQTTSGVEPGEHVLDLCVPVRRSRHARTVLTGGHDGDVVALVARHPCQHPDRGKHHVDLGVGERGGTGQRPTGRHDEREGVPALGPVTLDEQLPGTCRGLPVDVLDVVAGHIGAQIVEVHAAPRGHRRVLTVEQTHDQTSRVQPQTSLDSCEVRHGQGVGTAPKMPSMISSTGTWVATASKVRMSR